MLITITVDTGNDAFGESPSGETARILSDIVSKIEDGRIDLSFADDRVILDINGNVTGRLEITNA